MTEHVPHAILPARAPLGDDVLAQIFTQARTHSQFDGREVPETLLKRAVELAEIGPTAMNAIPARVVFVRSQAAKEKLKPALMGGNVDKTMAAPVTAIIAHDVAFYEDLAKNAPFAPGAREWFAHDSAKAAGFASMNGTLFGGYFIVALRSLGLDAGPMGGFDQGVTDEAFFAGTTWKSNFLINIGYGTGKGIFPRLPRYAFDEMAKIV